MQQVNDACANNSSQKFSTVNITAVTYTLFPNLEKEEFIGNKKTRTWNFNCKLLLTIYDDINRVYILTSEMFRRRVRNTAVLVCVCN